jgi:XTP/dITP diphosphohydrolase
MPSRKQVEPPPSILYIASTNAGKLRDFSVASELFDIAIEPLPGIADIPPAPEDEPTFEANARSKAEYYSRRAPELWIIADDSGLDVDALDGAPGVRSARFAADAGFVVPGNPSSIDVANNAYLLQRLIHIESPERTARYRCVLAVARDGIVERVADGTVEGVILSAPRGSGGFGYDPLFYLPALDKTMAEIDLASKQAFSHRGRALGNLLVDWR